MPEPVAGANTRRMELELEEVNQLFNCMDPSPFVARDLDGDAEEFIFNWAQEFPPKDPVTLRIHLTNWPAEDPTLLMTEAIHNFFAYREQLNQREFRLLMSQGRTSLFIGLTFLGVCLLVVQLLLHRTGPWAVLIRESVTIAGWVAMWRPMQIFLYEWWPVRRRGRIYGKLSLMPIEVIGKDATAAEF
jgi:hypothetical protein